MSDARLREDICAFAVSIFERGLTGGASGNISARGLPPEEWSSFEPEEDEGMLQKKHKPEEIVAKLRQVDVLTSQSQPVAEAVRSIGVTPFTYYRWRKEFGGPEDGPGEASEGA